MLHLWFVLSTRLIHRLWFWRRWWKRFIVWSLESMVFWFVSDFITNKTCLCDRRSFRCNLLFLFSMVGDFSRVWNLRSPPPMNRNVIEKCFKGWMMWWTNCMTLSCPWIFLQQRFFVQLPCEQSKKAWGTMRNISVLNPLGGSREQVWIKSSQDCCLPEKGNCLKMHLIPGTWTGWQLLTRNLIPNILAEASRHHFGQAHGIKRCNSLKFPDSRVCVASSCIRSAWTSSKWRPKDEEYSCKDWDNAKWQMSSHHTELHRPDNGIALTHAEGWSVPDKFITSNSSLSHSANQNSKSQQRIMTMDEAHYAHYIKHAHCKMLYPHIGFYSTVWFLFIISQKLEWTSVCAKAPVYFQECNWPWLGTNSSESTGHSLLRLLIHNTALSLPFDFITQPEPIQSRGYRENAYSRTYSISVPGKERKFYYTDYK